MNFAAEALVYTKDKTILESIILSADHLYYKMIPIDVKKLRRHTLHTHLIGFDYIIIHCPTYNNNRHVYLT